MSVNHCKISAILFIFILYDAKQFLGIIGENSHTMIVGAATGENGKKPIFGSHYFDAVLGSFNTSEQPDKKENCTNAAGAGDETEADMTSTGPSARRKTYVVVRRHLNL